MPLNLHDLSKAELLDLIDYAGVYRDRAALAQGWRGLLDHKKAQAVSRRAVAYAAWLPLSRVARADAIAARHHREAHGYDEMWTRKLEISLVSTRAANAAWREVLAIDAEIARFAAKLRLAGRIAA